jgi:nucleoside-diphosphate-sugar epimerase
MRRVNHPKTFLVTGGTGFLGSHIAVRLLEDGHCVLLLARARKHDGALERVKRLLDWFDVGENCRSRLEVLEGDLEEPLLGADVQGMQSLIKRVDEIIHCASDTSLSARKREQVERTNVRGLQNLLDVVQESRCRAFHLISTAYAAGKVSGLCPEDFGRAEGFHNVYEETKFKAEQIAVQRCAQRGITLYVHRPSIVYGDSTSGKTLLFNALYYPIRTLRYFQRLYTSDILENNGNKAQAMGVHMEQDGKLFLPVRIECLDASGVNLIPVDHFVKAFMAIRKEVPKGGVFHIVNSRNTPIRQLVDYTRRFFQLSGIRIADRSEFMKCPRNGLELLFENQIRVYGSYMRDSRIFENSGTATFLAGQNIICPDFSYDIFAICMRYAEDMDWGRLLYQEGNTACVKKSLMDTKGFIPRKSAV